MNARAIRSLLAAFLVSLLAAPGAMPGAMAIHIPGHDLVWVKDLAWVSPPYIDSNPHGRLNILVSIYKLLRDTTSSYDWYFYAIQIQSVPGWVAYGSGWQSRHTDSTHMLFNPSKPRDLKDYDPLTTDGYTTSTVSATITVSDNPAASFTKSDSYQIPYVRVEDWSDYSVHRAEWRHWFNLNAPQGSPTYTTWVSKPWFVVRTLQDDWTMVDAWYHVSFAIFHIHWFPCPPPIYWCWYGEWHTEGFTGPTVYQDAKRSGDS